MKRTIILMLDSLGLGATLDAAKFGDQGANTLGHIDKAYREAFNQPLELPHLSKLGLYHAAYEASGHEHPVLQQAHFDVMGAYGHAAELSTGKDTPSGHWEMAGVPVLFDWGYFTAKEDSFPQELLERIYQRAGLKGALGLGHASGTEILERLGDLHVETGWPIFYTSADSVFQIACHEETFGLERLYKLCEIVRQELEPYNIGRVIARPFVGESASTYKRTGNRRDYALAPPAPTVLDRFTDAGGQVIGIGKISDIYAGCGITKKVKAEGLEALFDATLAQYKEAPDQSIVFTNFVDFDSVYGHRRDALGYAQALKYFDQRLPELLEQLDPNDLLIVTADHGCDPTWPGTEHTREHVPLLALGAGLSPGTLGLRTSFADIGQSIAQYFNLPAMDYGQSIFKR
jgi:phosphopentomutase